MKRMEKTLAFLLCAVMILGMLPTFSFAADGETNIYAEYREGASGSTVLDPSTTNLEPGDTFRIRLMCNEMYISSFAAGFDFDTEVFEVTKITAAALQYWDTQWVYNEDTEEEEEVTDWFDKSNTSVSTVDEANESGHVGIVFAGATEYKYKAKLFCTVTLKVKEDASGSTAITLFEDSAGTDGYKGVWTATETITIVDPSTSTHEEPCYQINSMAQLTTGERYILVVDGNFALGDNTLSKWQPTIGDNKVSGTTVYYWTITVDGNVVTLQDVNGNYLAAAEGNTWTVSCENGKFSFFDGVTTTLAYHTGQGKFGSYAYGAASTTNQFTLYKLGTPCTHQSTKLVSNNNGTHNVVCADCNATVTTNVTCTGTDDGDHTTDAKCACGNVVVAGTEHTYTQNLPGTLKNAGDCDTKAVYAVKCDNCDHESDTLTVEGEYGNHVYGDLIPATDAVHTKDELKPGVAAHYLCSCGKYFTADKVETTLAALTGETPTHTRGTDATCTTAQTCTGCDYVFEDAKGHGHTAGFRYDSNGDNTHTKYCKDCSAAIEGEKNISCSDGNDAGEICDYCDNDLHVCTHDLYVTENGKHQSVCACGKNIGEAVPCSGGTATCTNKAVCSTCKTAYGALNAGNHASTKVTYTDNGDGTHSATHDCCNADYVINEQHDFTHDAENHKCICGKIEMFTITFNANGGTFENGAPVYSIESAYGYSFTTPILALSCDGYTFAGWNTKADGTGTSFDPTTYTFTENVTVYAQWTKNHVCVHESYVTENGKHQSYCSCGNPIGEAVACSDSDDADHNCDICDYVMSTCVHYEYRYVNEGTHQSYCACGEPIGDAAMHNANEDNCECGAFKIVFNNNDAKLNGEEVGNTYGFYYQSFTMSWDDDFCKQFFTKDGCVFKGYAYDLNGNDLLSNPEVITTPCTIYLVWDCNHDDEFHTLTTTYSDKEGATHTKTVTCDCGATVSTETVPHDYTTGTSEHTCICGAKFTGWEGKTYYVDAVMQTGWTLIGSDWYYFDTTTGIRAEGLTRVPYNTELGHAANPDDLAYNPSFKDATEAWYYFDANGKYESTKNGIIDGKYVVNGMIPWHPGFVTVGGELYYFVGDAENGGNKLADGVVYVTRLNGIDTYKTGYIMFKDGKVDTTYTGTAEIKENLFYFDSGVCVTGAGMVKTEDGLIFVRSGGQLAVGDYWVTAEKANGYVEGGKLYNFSENGILTINPAKNGIIDGVYYKEGVPYYAGLIEIDGDYYYVRSNGQVATGWYYVTKTNGIDLGTNKLFFGEDGKMQAVKNGICEGEDGKLYYYVNNRITGAGLIKIGDDYYYVKSSTGEVVTGTYYITVTNGMEGFTAGQKCVFDENGKLVK